MSPDQGLNRPIRVVMFGGGPELNRDAKLFLCKLEEHPEIDFLAAFCQAQTQSFGAVFTDLWKRRGLLSVPFELPAPKTDEIAQFRISIDLAFRTGLWLVLSNSMLDIKNRLDV